MAYRTHASSGGNRNQAHRFRLSAAALLVLGWLIWPVSATNAKCVLAAIARFAAGSGRFSPPVGAGRAGTESGAGGSRQPRASVCQVRRIFPWPRRDPPRDQPSSPAMSAGRPDHVAMVAITPANRRASLATGFGLSGKIDFGSVVNTCCGGRQAPTSRPADDEPRGHAANPGRRLGPTRDKILFGNQLLRRAPPSAAASRSVWFARVKTSVSRPLTWDRRHQQQFQAGSNGTTTWPGPFRCRNREEQHQTGGLSGLSRGTFTALHQRFKRWKS